MTTVPSVRNEPILTYAPGSPERAQIREALDDLPGKAA